MKKALILAGAVALAVSGTAIAKNPFAGTTAASCFGDLTQWSAKNGPVSPGVRLPHNPNYPGPGGVDDGFADIRNGLVIDPETGLTLQAQLASLGIRCRDVLLP